MFDIHITINSFIPESLRTKALDATVNALNTLGEGILSEEVLARAGQLSSDSVPRRFGYDTFGLAFEGALQRAAERFVQDYLEEDEDLVEAIADYDIFFKNREVEEALLRVLSEPVRYLEGDDEERLAIVSQSFATLFPRRRNRKRVKRAVEFLLKCIVSEVWHLPDLRAAYEVLAEHYRRTEADEKVFHNLPRPDYQRFVGRKKEQAELHRLLSPNSRHFVITIDGIGGIGKSALVLEVAHQHRQNVANLPQSERFDALIWATAKQSILTSQGIQPYNHTFRALDDIYSTIASALQREDITRARREEQEEIVTEALSQQRTLLIIDNLETVDDTRIMNFIRNVPRPTKVIVTTRHRLNVAYPMRLVGMSQEEALELISNEVNLKNITLTEPQAIRLYKRTGGVPLAIVWSIAQMSIQDDVETTLTRLSQPTSDIAQFCFEGAIELIRNSPAHNLLMALSLFATDASRDALGVVTNLPILDRDEGLEELERLSLVNKEGDRFALLPLTKAFANSCLKEKPELENDLEQAFIRYFLDFCGKYRAEHFSRFDIELKNIQLALKSSYDLKMWAEVGRFVDNLGGFLDKRGLWEELVNYAKMAVEAGIQINDKNLIMRQKIYGLGWLRISRLKNFKEGMASLEEGKQLAIELGDKEGYATALRNEGYLYVLLKDYQKSEILLHQSLAIWQEIGNDRWIMRTLLVLALKERQCGDLDKALDYYNQALLIAEEIEDTELKPLVLRRMGIIFAYKREFEKAHAKLKESISLYEDLNLTLDLARSYFVFAIVEYVLGRVSEAKIQAQKAYDIEYKFRRQHPLVQLKELFEALNESPNDPSSYLARWGV